MQQEKFGLSSTRLLVISKLKNHVTLLCKMATGEEKSPEDTTLAALESASKLTVTDENGQVIEFGSLFKNDKVIVIFVRVSLHCLHRYF